MISCRSKICSTSGLFETPAGKSVQFKKPKRNAENGLGRALPYGYVKDLETKKLVIDEEAAAVVKRIFALCAAGNGPSRIATILTKEKGALSQLLHLPEIRPDTFCIGHHEAVPLVGQRSREPVRK